jgi:thymidylate synthase
MPENELLEFIALHFADKVRIINPKARLGILTLWSRIDFVEAQLEKMGIDLHPANSKIAVIGNLYGNGLPHLLRNLLYNPQIRDLIICGANRSGSCEELTAFFEHGVEQIVSLGETVTRVKGTKRILDNLIQPGLFAEKPRLVAAGELNDQESRDKLYKHIQSFAPADPLSSQRIEIELPQVEVTHYPSEPRGCTIIADSPLAGWRELIFRLHRFGHLAHLRKGDRQELQNVKVVVTQPRDDEAELEKYGFSVAELQQYQKDMLIAAKPSDHSYTYGNRIREYFGFDSLDKFAHRLRNNPQDRDCYLALWDSGSDIESGDSPCLVSIFFRVYDEQLTLCACYRTHNALDAWLKNVYGLIETQRIVAEKVGIETGPLTVISHSISIDPSKYDLAERVAKSKSFSVNMDPNGQFMFSVDHDAGEIIAQHISNEGFLLHEYRSAKAERIQHEIARDCAVSDINHALYLGRQLAKAEICLKTGETYEES